MELQLASLINFKIASQYITTKADWTFHLEGKKNAYLRINQMTVQNELSRDKNRKSAKLSRGIHFFTPLISIPLVITFTLIGVGIFAIATDYRGSIELKISPDGGHLKINR